MITPIELQSKSFRTGIGYDKRDVDHFLASIQLDYETLYKENMVLNDKINTLNEGINYYKTIEKTLQKALVLAEQTADETKEAARKQAKAIEDEAIIQGRYILSDAENECQEIRQKTIQLIRQYESYKAQFKHLAAAQCELLESDSFKIEIAHLNSFAETEPSEKKSSYMTSFEQKIRKQKNEEIHEEIQSRIHHTSLEPMISEEESAITDDDFEFFDISEE